MASSLAALLVLSLTVAKEHSLSRAILAHIVSSPGCIRRQRIQCRRPSRRVFAVALHVADLFIQFEVVRLQTLDFSSELGDDVELLSQLLQTRRQCLKDIQ